MMRKSRHGARGVRKVSTGCLTCKRRHKKCDEARPACSLCITAGWKCDFLSPSPPATPPILSLQYPTARPLLDGEHQHMEFFQVVCAGECSIFFELPAWNDLLLQGTSIEPALHHAALAVGALARSRYHPEIWQTRTVVSFSVRHYNMAIQDLHRQLDGSSHSLELAVLASIVFCYIEFLLGRSKIEMHIQAGCAILENLSTTHNKTLPVSPHAESKSLASNSLTSYDILANAMSQITAQFNALVSARTAAVD